METAPMQNCIITQNRGLSPIVCYCLLNLFRLDTSKKKGGIYTRRILAASSDAYRASLLGVKGNLMQLP
ncbi:hypothetical protein [Propionivibrio sp.]|uniref:hypothetical protein n=1 Tax=Propionivibrio sp. TaxID=2212460 RepID=UPI00262788B5|nr:hypothetical protein [Propionivibrio sp.]